MKKRMFLLQLKLEKEFFDVRFCRELNIGEQAEPHERPHNRSHIELTNRDGLGDAKFLNTLFL